MSNTRDSLGFLLPALTAAEAIQAAASTQTKQNRAVKWVHKQVPTEPLCPSSGPTTTLNLQYHSMLFDKDLKVLVRQGIPSELRPTMWFWLSGGYTLHLSAPADLYTKLAANTTGLDDAAVLSVMEGLHTKVDPSFGLNALLQTSKGKEALARIMFALLKHSPGIRYCRSLHQLAAFMLIVMGLRYEEQAFWTLLGAIKTKLFPSVDGQVHAGEFIEQAVLEQLVHKKMPRLGVHMAKSGWELTGITSGWFSTCFTSHLPPETAVRVWDAVISEGSKVLHRVALAIIKRHETVISSCSQLQVMRKILDLRMSRIIDDDELMHAAFRRVGSMPGSMLKGFRQRVMDGPAYARFKAVQAVSMALRLEPTTNVIATLTPPVPSGSKGWLGKGAIGRISNNGSYSGGRDGRDSVGDFSQAASDCSYNSDGGESMVHRKRTASGRPRQNVHFLEA